MTCNVLFVLLIVSKKLRVAFHLCMVINMYHIIQSHIHMNLKTKLELLNIVGTDMSLKSRNQEVTEGSVLFKIIIINHYAIQHKTN